MSVDSGISSRSTEIDRLEGLVQELKQKQTKIRDTIGNYSRILAPIRRVPSDILCTIFAHCLPTDYNPGMGASECPVLLTRVCSAWRSLAIASPRLWAQIHISFLHISTCDVQGYTEFPYGHSSIPSQQVIDVLRLRCRGIGEWLSQSGVCSLAVSISYDPHFQRREREWSDEGTTNFFLESLIPFSSRWRELQFLIPLPVYCGLESMLSAREPTTLEQLNSTIFDQPNPLNLNLELSLNLFKSPTYNGYQCPGSLNVTAECFRACIYRGPTSLVFLSTATPSQKWRRY